MDRTALITGASRGLGYEVAVKLHRQNWNLALCSKHRPIDVEGPNVLTEHLNVENEADVVDFIDTAYHRFKRIDVLLNDAGYCHPLRYIEDLSYFMFDTCLRVNTIGPFLTMKYVIPIMRKQGRGLIVNIASTSGEFPNDRLPGYSASKAALIMLTKAVKKELKETDIECCYISPPAMSTDMRKEVVGDNESQPSPETFAEYIVKMINGV